MKFKVLVPVAIIAAGLMGIPGQASAKDGKQGAALLGGAAGIAIGAVGATMYNNSQQQQAPQPQRVQQQPEYTGSVSNRGGDCETRPVKLYDRAGTYVKTERMRICD